MYSSRKFRPRLCSTWPGFESGLDPTSRGFYCRGAGATSLSSNTLAFCFLFLSEGLRLFLTHMSLVLSRVVCPLCLSSLLLAQFLDRKCEIYFVWPELHCSFLTTGVTSLQITRLCAYCLCKVRAWGEQAYLGAAVREGDKAYRARKEIKRQRGDREKGKKLRYNVKTFGLEEIPFRQQ